MFKRSTLRTRMAHLTMAVGVLATISTPTAKSQAAGYFWGPQLPDMVEKVLPSVVNISTTTVVNYKIPGWEGFYAVLWNPSTQKHTSLGSGLIIDNQGYILTNSHVVDRATEVVVTLHDKRNYNARVVGKDPKQDLALIQIRDKKRGVPKKLSPAKTGNSDTVRIAEPVVAIGNPFGLQHSVTGGIISAKNRTIGVGPLDNFLQTDASINPGNSGGPLFNLKGEVIGINSAIRSNTGQSAGLGFAIPINEALQVVPNLKKYGRVPRPWLGVLGQTMTRRMMRYYELYRPDGVLVYRIFRDAPAQQAGIREGDIVVKVGKVATKERVDLERALAKLKPTDKVTVTIQRGKKQKKLNIKLRELPPRLDGLKEGII